MIPGILAGLKSHGIEASGEGGNPLTDSAAVEMILSLLSWADHPGHSAARYHVCAGGMAEVFGCGKVPAKISVEDTEARDFLKKLRTKITDCGLAEVVSGWVASKEWREAERPMTGCGAVSWWSLPGRLTRAGAEGWQSLSGGCERRGSRIRARRRFV